MTYQPLLAETAAGNVEPRHIAIPLRRLLPEAQVITGELTALSHTERRATVRLTGGETRSLGYDHVVVAPGSVTRMLPIPGLAETAIGLKSIGEAVDLRNRLLERLGFAASTADLGLRRKALTFVVVGGGYAGVEALGEMSDMTEAVIDVFDGLREPELRWELIEATGRILPEVDARLGDYVAGLLRRRGVNIRLNTRITSCVDGEIQLDPGDPFSADTVLWTAGVRPHPVLEATDLPRDGKGRLITDAFLRVHDSPGAWSAGDCAAVPDLASPKPGSYCPPTAQHAVRQARRLADNILAELRGRPGREYRHRYAGSVAGLGRFQGAAQIYRLRVRGLLAWLMHRGYHWLALPSAGRQARVLADWIIGAIFPRDIVSLGEVSSARRASTSDTRGTPMSTSKNSRSAPQEAPPPADDDFAAEHDDTTVGGPTGTADDPQPEPESPEGLGGMDLPGHPVRRG